MRTTIYINTTVVGLHHWPGAAIHNNRPDLPQGDDNVEFLMYPHRHVFHIKVTLLVTDLDREVEFFTFKKHVDAIAKKEFTTFVTTYSCERMATILFVQLKDFSVESVEVSEDGENGAIVYK